MSAVATEAEQVPRRWARLRELFAGEGQSWLFVGKTLLAMYLAAWLAMWLQLEQPSTTMITVAIVMHPQSGMVLAKSFYRAIGTLTGSLFGLSLLCLFPQQRELFLFCLSLWVALCAGGALLYRNFMSYGFVLAGYTAAIVTLPVVNHPLGVFDSTVMRVSEVMLGILVAGVISDLVFPDRLRNVLRQSARAQFAQFIDFVRDSTGGVIPRADMEQAHLRFVRTAVQLEDMRAAVIFEDPEARARSARMRLLNQRYMAASTSFQSLHHLINRQQRGGQARVADALIALYRPIGTALAPDVTEQHDPAVLAPRLRECADVLPARAIELRAELSDSASQLEFDTGATLLQRFAGELLEFTTLEDALRRGQQRGSVERVHFRRGNDYAGAGVAVLRTFLTMTTLSVFWLMSSWPFGASAMLIATIFSGLLAASPKPINTTVSTLSGYAAGMLAAFLVTFWLLPGSDSFIMLITATLPFMLIGPYLNTHPQWASVGAGYSIGFVYILALKNPMVYDPMHFLNDMIAQLVGVLLTGMAFMVLPAVTGSQWQRERQLRSLREQVVLAATAPLDGLVWRFESVSRDLFQQVVAHTHPGSEDARSLLAWALTVHESGRALIELRQQLQHSTLNADAKAPSLLAIQRVAQLYRQRSAANWALADQAVQQALAVCMKTGMDGLPIRPLLHQLRSALHDDESPLAIYMPAPLEPTHAA